MTVIIRQVCATAEEVFNTLDEVEKKKRGGGGRDLLSARGTLQ